MAVYPDAREYRTLVVYLQPRACNLHVRRQMTHTREEVLASVKAMFGESKLAEVLATLDEYGTESYEREVNRVNLALLQLSEGKTEKLLYWASIAKPDDHYPHA